MAELDIDHILANIVGGAGKWQWTMVFAMWPITFAAGYPLLLHMFTAFAPRHRCFVPGCDNASNNDIDAQFKSYALPQEYSSSEIFVTEKFDPCNMYERKSNADADSCDADAFDNQTLVACHTFVYDHSLFNETLTTKLDLVCDQESKRRLLGTIMMLGLMIGSLLGGRLSDKFGRRKVMIWAIILIVPCVMFGGYSPNYECYLILRLISCSALPCIWISNSCATVEIFDPESRKNVMLVKDLLWPSCQLILIAIIYFVRHWTNMHLVVGAFGLLGLPCFLILPESPRWLANNGHKHEAEKIFLNIAKWNGKTITSEQKQDIKTILNRVEAQAHESTEANLNILNMFKMGNLKKTLIMLLNWITINVGSYTLLLNSTKLHGDLFVNYVLTTVAGDIPGTIALIFTMKYFGRRFNLFYMQTTIGICCLIMAFVPKTETGVILAFFLIGKCCAGAGFLLVWVITAELFPTNLRSQALGFCSMIARIFGLVCPFVANLAMYWKPLPMVVLGLPCLMAGILAYFIPETKGKELPQNMRDTQNGSDHEMAPMKKKEVA